MDWFNSSNSDDGSSCDAYTTNSNESRTNSGFLHIDTNSLSDDLSYFFSVTIRDPLNPRPNSTDTVLIEASDEKDSLMIWTQSRVVDSTKQLKLYAATTNEMEYYTWKEMSGLLPNLTGNAAVSGANTAVLTLQPNLLSPGTTYVCFFF